MTNTAGIKATHVKSGRTGRILDTMEDSQNISMYWFEQDFSQDGSASGWKYSQELDIPGVNS